MKAAIFHAPLDVRVEAAPDPDPGAGEVLVQVDAALTCGTDAKTYRRGHPLLLGPPPAPFGHEYAGTVVAVGPGAPFAVGTRVCGANSAPCGLCGPCRRDCESLCENLLPLLNGAYAELLCVPARIAATNLHALPPGVAAELGAMLEPLACALHGVEASEARPGERVCVLGRGALGRMIAAALQARGCEVVVLASRDPDPVGGFDRVIEAAGNTAAWQRAIALTERGGTCVLFGGLPGGSQVAVDAYRLHYEALTLRGVFHHAPRHVHAALQLIAADPRPFAALLTHEFRLDDVTRPLAMNAGLEPRRGLLKAVIRP